MKKLFILLMAFAAALCLTTCAQTQPEPEPDYLDAMVRAAARGDVRAGHTAESMRELSQGKSEDYVPVSFDDLYTLSRYIYLKYGSYRCSDELRLCAGEVVLNSIDTDGVKGGFDLEMLSAVCDAVNVPVIASGGAGKIRDFVDLFKTVPKVDAGLAASIFHFGEVRIPDLKAALKENNITVRL